MADPERRRNALAVLFVVFALVLLALSVSTTNLGDQSLGLVSLHDAKKAPDFTLSDARTGQSVDLQQQSHSMPIVFTFWATWCGPCRMELPHIEELSRRYAGRVGFYAVDSDDSPEIEAAFAEQHGFTFSVLSDVNHTANSAYGISNLPTLFVVDRSGLIRYSAVGFDPDESATDLDKALDGLLAEHT